MLLLTADHHVQMSKEGPAPLAIQALPHNLCMLYSLECAIMLNSSNACWYEQSYSRLHGTGAVLPVDAVYSSSMLWSGLQIELQEVVRYTVAVHDGDRGQGHQPPRWAQATPRSWLPQPPLPQVGPPQQPGPPRLMAAGQPPFQVLFCHIIIINADNCQQV